MRLVNDVIISGCVASDDADDVEIRRRSIDALSSLMWYCFFFGRVPPVLVDDWQVCTPWVLFVNNTVDDDKALFVVDS